jgi:iron complex transport system permease protein
VERFKLLALGAASLVVAGAVSVSGLIGFVGLMVPHMMRLVVGPRHRLLLPASVLAGAVVLVLADLLARVVLAPVEIPVGIVTALAGGPFFIWLLVRKERAR